jgi:hypothetical protein
MSLAAWVGFPPGPPKPGTFPGLGNTSRNTDKANTNEARQAIGDERICFASGTRPESIECPRLAWALFSAWERPSRDILTAEKSGEASEDSYSANRMPTKAWAGFPPGPPKPGHSLPTAISQRTDVRQLPPELLWSQKDAPYGLGGISAYSAQAGASPLEEIRGQRSGSREGTRNAEFSRDWGSVASGLKWRFAR